jgi:hypothetical protein
LACNVQRRQSIAIIVIARTRALTYNAWGQILS